jgi:hypothetical protein
MATSTTRPNERNQAGYEFTGGYPSGDTSQRLYDEMDYQRAVQAYIWGTTLVNSVGLNKALENLGVKIASPAIVVIDKPLSPKQIVMTGNDVSTYGLSCIDLSKTGPFTLDAPEGVLDGKLVIYIQNENRPIRTG